MPNIAKGKYPYLIPYVKKIAPAKPKPGTKAKVTLGVWNGGAAEGKLNKVLAWSDAFAAGAISLCGAQNSTASASADLSAQAVAPGAQVLVTIEVPVPSTAGAWREMKFLVDADCTNPSPYPAAGPKAVKELSKGFFYQIKG
jgi:hypothetical protein